MRGIINKRNIEKLSPGDTLWDQRLPGFGVHVEESGKRFFKSKDVVDGKVRWTSLGQYTDAFTPELARQAAKKLKGKIAAGDPAVARGKETVDALFKLYLSEWAQVRKKPRSIAEDIRNYDRHIKRAIGGLKVTAVTDQHLGKIHGDLQHIPIAANRVRALASKMFNLAEKKRWRPRGTNPVSDVEKYPERARLPDVSPETFRRLGEALRRADEHEHPIAMAAIKLIALSGMRKGEVLTLQWAHVDLAAHVLRLPDSKTGEKVVALGSAACELLAGLDRWNADSNYVFPRTRAAKGDVTGEKDGHFVGLGKVWDRIRKDAGLATLRIHDLRHGFASAAVSGGQQLGVVGQLLGHREQRTTEKYSHYELDPLVRAADQVSSTIASMLAGAPKAPVSKLRRRP